MTIAIASRTTDFIRAEMPSGFRAEGRNRVRAGTVASFVNLAPFIALHGSKISGA